MTTVPEHVGPLELRTDRFLLRTIDRLENLEQPSMIAYIWRTYFWPGVRLNYDGTPRVLEEPGEDEAWFDLPEESGAPVRSHA